MDLAMERASVFLALLLMAGCNTPETRFLAVNPRAPEAEIASYKWHDPFPDEDAGPRTYTRPRIFMEPRTDSQKSFDLRYIKAAYGYPQQRYAWDSPRQVGATSYPVQPIWRSPPNGQPSAQPIASAGAGW